MIPEERAKQIHSSSDLTTFTHDELRETDLFIRNFALDKLEKLLRGSKQPKVITDYLILIVSATYGSVETDEFLQSLKCYPDWC